MEAGGKRWVGVGRSSAADATVAGREAARLAVHDRDARLVVVFCSDSFDLAALLAGIREVTAETPLIGCSTAGEIATGGPGDTSVVVTALGGPGFSCAAACATDASSRLRDASAEVAACMSEIEDRPHRVLLLLPDGLAGDQQEVVRGAYSVVGATVPLVGGCAGDDLKMRQTYQLCGDRVLKNAVVGAAIGSDAPIGIGVQHGWRTVGEPMMVTSSSENRVYALDDRPALDVYLERLEAPDAARQDPDAFTRFAITHPLGLNRRGGEEVRFVGEANFDDRSLGCIAQVPQGGLAWFMEGNEQSVLAATDSACSDALAGLRDSPAIAVMAFDCIGRRGVLGDEGIKEEISRIRALAAGAPIAGFYTYGEIARTRGISGFHNHTLVVLALS